MEWRVVDEAGEGEYTGCVFYKRIVNVWPVENFGHKLEGPVVAFSLEPVPNIEDLEETASLHGESK